MKRNKSVSIRLVIYNRQSTSKRQAFLSEAKFACKLRQVLAYSNNEDPDEMPHYGAFYQGLHYLLRQKGSSEIEIHFLFEKKNL